uniref:Uncharacterized protein n=2 Tax=Dendroctonus ponderosae TaxID=77166 RepID=A0AAR5PZF5_DENPD
MGCASSAPLVEQGKHLVEGVKDTANDTMAKGEKALHETTDTIKDGISSGIDSMKETVQSVFTTAEESVGSVAHKLGETLSLTTSKTAENLKNAQEITTDLSAAKGEMLSGTVDAAAEAVSEAETVVMSEAEQAREAFQSGTSPFFETVHSLGDEVDSTLANTAALALDKAEDLEVSMHHTLKQGGELLEDLETDAKDMLGESVKTMKAHVEELHEGPRPDKEE